MEPEHISAKTNLQRDGWEAISHVLETPLLKANSGFAFDVFPFSREFLIMKVRIHPTIESGHCTLFIGSHSYVENLPLAVASRDWHKLYCYLRIVPKQIFAVRYENSEDIPAKIYLGGVLYRQMQ